MQAFSMSKDFFLGYNILSSLLIDWFHNNVVFQN